jgi:hypothetical protein
MPEGARIGREGPDRWAVLCHKPPRGASAGEAVVRQKAPGSRTAGVPILPIRSNAGQSDWDG